MQCTACRKVIEGEFKFCPHCGNKLNAGCSGCGRNLMPEWVNCPYCGVSVKAAAAFQPTQNQTMQQYPAASQGHSDYHYDSSGRNRKSKKGLLGSFFSS